MNKINIKKLSVILAVMILASLVLAGAGAAAITPLSDETSITIIDADTGNIVHKTVAELGLTDKAYGIYDANDLFELATDSQWSNHGYSFVLMNDIDCSTVTAPGSDKDNFPSIGRYQDTKFEFNSNLYGNGKKITEFRQEGNTASGLIWLFRGETHDIGYDLNYIQMENCSIIYIPTERTQSHDLGGIVSSIELGNMRITGCSIKHSTIISNGGSFAGGICGYCRPGYGFKNLSYCSVENCLVIGANVYESGYTCGQAGGIIGYVTNNNSGIIKGCSLKDSVVIGASAAGIVESSNENLTIDSGDVTNSLIMSIDPNRGCIVGGVVGLCYTNTKIRNLTVENTTIGAIGHSSGVIQNDQGNDKPIFEDVKVTKVAVTATYAASCVGSWDPDDPTELTFTDTYLYGECYKQDDVSGVTTGKEIAFYDSSDVILGTYKDLPDVGTTLKISKSKVDGNVITDVGTYGVNYGYKPSSGTEYAITVNQGSHGTVTQSATSAEAGTMVFLVIEPDDGYQLSSITSPDVSLEGTGNIRIFTMPGQNVDITAVFSPVASGSSSVTSFFGTKDGSDFTFKRAVVITKATLPGATYATVTNTSGSGWYNCSLSTDGTNGTLYFQVPLDVIDIKGYTVNDVSLIGCKTTYLSSDNQYAYYSAVITGAGSYTIDFEKDAAAKVVEKVQEAVEQKQTAVEQKQAASEKVQEVVEQKQTAVEQKQPAAKSPFPVLGILAGLGIAGLVALRRH